MLSSNNLFLYATSCKTQDLNSQIKWGPWQRWNYAGFTGYRIIPKILLQYLEYFFGEMNFTLQIILENV